MGARASRHCGRKGNARHNDRDFDTSKAKHIDPTKSDTNYYWHCYQDTEPELSFEQAEKKYYQEHYSQALQKQNERYIKQRHKENVKSIDDLYKSQGKQPCENMLQIGNKDNNYANVTPELFMQIYDAYRKKFDAWNDAHGNHVHILSMAIHNDESGPHGHERIVFDYMSKDGLKLEQKNALKLAGLQCPDPTKKQDTRYNNRKQTFDAEMRGLWIETCKEFGIDIIEEPLPTHKHKAKEEYIDEQIQKKSILNDNLQKENDTLQKEINSNKSDAKMLREQVVEYMRTLEKQYLQIEENNQQIKDNNEMAKQCFNRMKDIILDNGCLENLFRIRELLQEKYPTIYDRILKEIELENYDFEQNQNELTDGVFELDSKIAHAEGWDIEDISDEEVYPIDGEYNEYDKDDDEPEL